MNQTFNNVTLLGQLNFNDGSSIQSTDDLKFVNVSAFSRNTIDGTTSLLQDKFIANNDISCLTQVIAPSAKIQFLKFVNDLDQDGNPVIQNKGFSNELRTKLLSASEGIGSIIPDILEPPLKKAKLNLAEFVSTTNGSTTIAPNNIQLSNTSSKLASFKVNNANNKLEITTTNNIIDMSNNSLENVTDIKAPSATNVTIDGNNNSVIFKTGNVDRVNLNNNGVINFATGNIDTVNGIFTGTFDGTASYSITALEVECKSDNTNGNWYLPFTKIPGTASKLLFIDDVTGPLTYNPSTSTLTATNFSGLATNATNINCTSDNTNGSYFLTFTKSAGTGLKQLFIDDSTTVLTYNPSTNIISATCSVSQLTAAAVVVQTSANQTHYVFFGGLAGNSNIRAHTNLLFNPGTNTLTSNIVTATESVNTPVVQNSSGNLTLGCNSTGAGGKIILSGGTDLLSANAGGNAHQHLAITVNGVDYKIGLLNV
jgi:hypothetical protein